jgi:hypothetical protein
MTDASWDEDYNRVNRRTKPFDIDKLDTVVTYDEYRKYMQKEKKGKIEMYSLKAV